MKLWMKIGGGFCLIVLIAVGSGVLTLQAVRKVERASSVLSTETMSAAQAASQLLDSFTAANLAMLYFSMTRADSDYQSVVSGIGQTQGVLSEIRKVAEESKNTALLAQLEEMAKDLVSYLELAQKTSENFGVLEKRAKLVKDVADGYLMSAYDYLERQREELAKSSGADGAAETNSAALKRLAAMTQLVQSANANIADSWKAIGEDSSAKVQQAAVKAAKISDEVEALRKITSDSADQSLLDDLASFNENYQMVLGQLAQMYDEFGNLAAKRNEISKRVQGFAQELNAENVSKARASSIENAESLGRVAAQSAVALIVVALAGAAMTFGITRAITTPVRKSVGLASAIEKGDLSQRLNLSLADEIGDLSRALDSMASALEKKAELANTIAGGDLTPAVTLASDVDTLGRALSVMTESLNRTVGLVREAVEQVSSGSAQVADASQSLSQGATEQAASLQEITSSITEISAQTRTNAEHAGQASNYAEEAAEAARVSMGQMQQMMSAMDDIQAASKEIVKINKAIDDIAFQTNLLALNAAVEAARAGMHGKGFAVVAEEVRHLAARSAEAARDTSERIEGSLQKIEHGVQVAAGTVKSLGVITDKIKNVSGIVVEIAAASNEQAESVAQITQGLHQIDGVTQQNTANAEQTASAAEELSSQAMELQNLIRHFKVRT